MIFHEIDMQGSNLTQRLSTTPGVSGAVEGRFLYAQDIDTFVFSSATAFKNYIGFQTVEVSGSAQHIHMTLAEDTLTFVSGIGLTVTTTPASKKVTFTSIPTWGKITSPWGETISATSVGDTLTFEASGGSVNINTLAPGIKGINIGGKQSMYVIKSAASPGLIYAGQSGDLIKLASSSLYFNCDPTNRRITVSVGSGDGFLAPGRKIWVYQTTAPAGWIIHTNTSSQNGTLLAVKAASGTYAVSGGTIAGSWAHPTHKHSGATHFHYTQGHIHSLSSHVHSTSNVVLSLSQFPNHAHNYYDRFAGSGAGTTFGSGLNGQIQRLSYTRTSAGVVKSDGNMPAYGTSHGHGNTGINTGGAPVIEGAGIYVAHNSWDSSDNSLEADAWRPVMNQGIIIQKV